MNNTSKPFSSGKRIFVAVVGVGLLTLVLGQSLVRVMVGRQPDGSVVLPTGQSIKPLGRQLEFNGRPNAVALSPDGKTVAVLETGTEAAILLLDFESGKTVQEFGGAGGSASYAGIAYSRDGKKLYASQGDGHVVIASVGEGGTLTLDAKVETPKKDKDDNAYPGGLALSEDGKTLYVALSKHNTLGVFDLTSRSFTAEIPVGNAPHAVVLRGGIAYVSNQGGRTATGADFTVDSSGTKIVADRTSGFAVSGTVSVVDLAAKRVSANIAVGQQPTALLLEGNRLFVANTNSDTVSLIDTRSSTVVKTYAIKPFAGALLGSSPNALALMGNRLLVSLGRNNAVAVYTLGQGAAQDARFDGLLPVGFYPGDLLVRGSSLIVANNKGVGSLAKEGSSGPDEATNKTGKQVYQDRGSLSVLELPDAAQLEASTAAVLRNDNWTALAGGTVARPNLKATPVPLPARVGEPSVFKHVFYIIKENRTYDQMYGDLKAGNGDSRLQQFGPETTPNQRALMSRYALLDNIYDSGTLSADGHNWATQAFVVDYIEKSFYDFTRSYPYNGGDALAYAQSGFLWDNAKRHGKSVKVYGEYALEPTYKTEKGTWSDFYNDYLIETGQKSGTKHALWDPTRSDVPSLQAVLDKGYPGYDNSIPDVYKAALFAKSFQADVQAGKVPDLTLIQLPNDHTEGTNPGSATPRAMIADNDLAVGRVVEAISKSSIWKQSVIFIIEDDTQNGVDHVDGHRTPALVISPYTQRGVTVSDYYTQIDFVRAMEQILGLPPMNQMDMAVPGDSLKNVFTNTPNFAPFTALENKVPLTELNPKKAALEGLPLEWSTAMSGQNFKQADHADEALLNRAIWYSSKGYSAPYPSDPRVFAPNEVHPYLVSQGRDTPLGDTDDALGHTRVSKRPTRSETSVRRVLDNAAPSGLMNDRLR